MANVRIQIRRDHSTEWTNNNPLLAEGEQGYELDTSFMKVGDGVTEWIALPYWNTGTIQGPPGPEGPDGPEGPQGIQGQQGIQGVQGVPGKQGDEGVPGLDGKQGIPGAIGPSGASVRVQGSVATEADLQGIIGVAENDAYIVETNSHVYVWNSSDWVDCGPLVIVQGAPGKDGSQGRDGEKGDTGDDGPQGIQGIQGLQGIPGKDGDQGKKGDTGDQGDKGNDGKSAYEVAADNGFIGTEQEWLDSLVGPPGDGSGGGLPTNDPRITDTQIDNWNTSYTWGDHGSAQYLTTETDPVFSASPAAGITNSDIVNWNSGTGSGGGGDDPRITDIQIGNWDDAHGWGNHAAEGYITGFTEQDPIFKASAAFTITAAEVDKWNDYEAEITTLKSEVSTLKSEMAAVKKDMSFSTTAPSNPDPGNLWIDANDITVYVWEGSGWVQLNAVSVP